MADSSNLSNDSSANDLGASDKEERGKAAQVILQQPELFKICEGCSSILHYKTEMCPSCGAYRFETDVGKVIAHTKKISQQERQSVLNDDFY